MRKFRNHAEYSDSQEWLNLYNKIVKDNYKFHEIERSLNRFTEIDNEVIEIKRIQYQIEINKVSEWFVETEKEFTLLSIQLYEETKRKKYESLASLPHYDILTGILSILETGHHINILKSTVKANPHF